MQTVSDPGRCVRDAAGGLLLIGALGLVLGAVAQLFHIHELLNRGLNLGVAAQGLVYVLLSFFVARRSLIATGLAVALVLADVVATFLPPMRSGTALPIGAWVIQAFLLFCLLRGAAAIRALRSR